MKNKTYIFIFIILIICLILYLYVKSESFDNSIPTTSNIPISSQLTSAIANVIGISPRRISDLIFTGDISKMQLNISFTILEANLIELSNNEMKADNATAFSDGLFAAENFIVKINNQSVFLNKTKSQTKNQNSITPTNTANVFDNTSLITIANYATNKYISIPNDSSLTNFYKLDIDNNYDIKPGITIHNTY